ncbi:MAG: hypothetical protein KC478_13765 [Bacteriovoracaceae bacterium]|nr:hypothetical protein [Bacteriovoracaceae bacterium]
MLNCFLRCELFDLVPTYVFCLFLFIYARSYTKLNAEFDIETAKEKIKKKVSYLLGSYIVLIILRLFQNCDADSCVPVRFNSYYFNTFSALNIFAGILIILIFAKYKSAFFGNTK